MPTKRKSLALTDPPDELKRKFLDLKSRSDVAAFLDVSLQQLTYHLFVVKGAKRYTKFNIAKSSGGLREIQSPVTALKLIQKKLNQALQCVYEPRHPVHGFVSSRSIVSNARLHVGARFILNLDLKDFFPSINFGRVRGMFIARPYALAPEAATVLAQVCCFENGLPQGAPTSPVVSNMVCAKLDADLQKLAQRYNCLYSRYADDLTFSTRANSFPKSLARIVVGPGGPETMSGGELEKAVSDNGFQLNALKTRLQTRGRRQAVTGLTVNQFPNVRRQYVNQVRAMLHAWRRFGPDLAEAEFRKRYDRKPRNPKSPPPSFKRVVKGKLDFLAMVRGTADSVCIRLLREYARLDPTFKFTSAVGPNTSIELAKDAVWVLEALAGSGQNMVSEQGTAFFLAGVGLVTCAHVLRPQTRAIRAQESHIEYPVRIVATDEYLDLAVLEVPGVHHDIELPPGDPTTLRQSQPIRLLGFPNYAPGNQCALRNGEVTAFRMVSGFRRILVDANIIIGNSGGPVLDANNRVIGVAAKGAASEADAEQTDKHEVIPIDALNHLNGVKLRPGASEA
ncbi:MAG: trypsin-like peptidase domain-containing protein [Bryobacteraceae bacterium]